MFKALTSKVAAAAAAADRFDKQTTRVEHATLSAPPKQIWFASKQLLHHCCISCCTGRSSQSSDNAPIGAATSQPLAELNKMLLYGMCRYFHSVLGRLECC